MHFRLKKNTIFADQNVIIFFHYESTHPNTRNLGVAEIHTSASQILTHPNGHALGMD